MAGETVVRVLAKHIRKGIAGDCHRCPVAEAIEEAVGQRFCDPRLLEIDFIPYLVVWSQYLPAPTRVKAFFYEFDSLPRNESGRPKLPAKLSGDLAPFTFTLPPFGDPEWQESCSGCEHVFDASELHEEGLCSECQHPIN